MTSETYHSLRQFGLSVARESLLTSWELIKITVPVLIVTQLLVHFGVIDRLSGLLAPVMGLIGLPGALGLVWMTAMLTSLYGGIAVFAALSPGLDLTAAQVTILSSVMLIAHSLPLELSISQKAGANFLPIGLLRLGGAIVYGMLLHYGCELLQIWQQPVRLVFSQTDALPPGVLPWAGQQLRNLAIMVIIIAAIVVVMRLLRLAGILTRLERFLAPVLPVFGMGQQAAPVTVVGMLMGIGYGGALIIRETCSGLMSRKEVFCSMALMGLCHGLIEDTLLMAAIGGKLGGIFWGRIVFSLAVIYVLVKLINSFASSTPK